MSNDQSIATSAHTIRSGKRASPHIVACIAALGAWLWLGHAAAQNNDGDSSGARTDRAFEEIVVQARRRDENVQSVPDQVSVFNEGFIDNVGIEGLDDFAIMTPGLFFGDAQPGVSVVNVRGVSQWNGQDSPPVAFVVDGVVQANALVFDVPYFDLEQIEVLRGPQGALYGRNSIGGAIILRTKQPTNDFEVRGRLTAGTDNYLNALASVSGPIVEDKLLFRLTGMWNDFDGYHTDIRFNEEMDLDKSKYLRAYASLFASDALTLKFIANWADQERGGHRWRVENVPANPAVPFPNDGLPITGVSAHSFVPVVNTEFWDVSMKGDWELNAGTVSFQSSHADLEVPRLTELDFTRRDIVAGLAAETGEVTTHEVRFTSPGDGRVRWLAGGFYQNQQREQNISVWIGRLPEGAPDAIIPNSVENVSTAVFGQMSVDLSDRVELTLAGRYDENDVEQKTTNREETFSDFQLKAQLSFDITDSAMVYGTYSEGYRSGGFNSTDFYAPMFSDETLTNYELGMKTNWLDGALTLNGAVYFIDYEDQQVFVFDPTGGSFNLINVDESETFGVEIDAWLRLGEGWDINAGYAHTDPEIQDFGLAGNRNDINGTPTEQFNGNTVPFTPENRLNLGVQYTTQIGSRGLTLVSRFDYVHTDDVAWDLHNSISQSAYDLVNLRFTLSGNNWSVAAYAKNVFDEDYDTLGYSGADFNWFDGVDIFAPGDPANAGIEVGFRF